jgi:hypothetical protein
VLSLNFGRRGSAEIDVAVEFGWRSAFSAAMKALFCVRL